MSELHCIFNPRASAGRTGRRWPDIARRLAAAGFSVTAHQTAAPGDATRLAREALNAGAQTIVAVGGDGTIHEVANGFFDDGRPTHPEARLGIVPGGSGSDLIKTLGIPSDVDGAIARLVAGHTRTVDVGRVSFIDHAGAEATRIYLNTASAGLSGVVLDRMRDLPGFLTGSAAYAAATLLSLGQFRPFACEVTLDDQPADTYRALLVVMANGRYFGGGMEILPDASMDDGLLDVLVAKDRPLWELFLNFPRLYTGTHLDSPIIASMRARRVRLDSAAPLLLEVDGEQPGVTPATFEVLGAAMRVIS
jgi:YegS/Rv2252/BmrU family lipid kinase